MAGERKGKEERSLIQWMLESEVSRSHEKGSSRAALASRKRLAPVVDKVRYVSSGTYLEKGSLKPALWKVGFERHVFSYAGKWVAYDPLAEPSKSVPTIFPGKGGVRGLEIASYLWELNPLKDPFIHDDLPLTGLNGLPTRTVLEGGGKLDAVALVAQLDLYFDKRADSRLLRSFLQSCSLGSMSSRSCPKSTLTVR
ncbi:hypothetical protein GOBAR_AA40018 [Gossypium barbadense]|uniref:Uncharacterized protein n=1 Tax=Gossypium barbadense TaxID=3634 RepID=A0A2P5VPC0_GOSBA|nr:hypothetical protein GOBAR_AA40018 [Gossypium barbadense]